MRVVHNLFITLYTNTYDIHYEYASMGAFYSSGHRCGSHKLKEDVDLDKVEHKENLEKILSSSSSSSSSSSNLRSNVFSDTGFLFNMSQKYFIFVSSET